MSDRIYKHNDVRGGGGYPILHPLRSILCGPELKQIVRGNGIYVQDQDGRNYIDGISGLWNVALGYNHPEIKAAIREQLELLPFINLYEFGNPTTLAFAEQLLGVVPPALVKLMYACSGSEAVEIAVKVCRKYYALCGKPRKRKFLCLDISYHGTTYAAMSASGLDDRYCGDYEPKVPGFIYLETPFCRCCPPDGMSVQCIEGYIKQLEDAFVRERDELAGVILEPVIGSGGVIPLPAQYLKRVGELCAEHDVLLVLDEVATGFGRTGKMFAFGHYSLVPDLLCLSKGINGGYLPLGATLFNEKICSVLRNSNSHVEHFSTQNGNPLACAAGLAVLHVVNDAKFLQEVTAKGGRLQSELTAVLARHRNFFAIRGKGLMMGIDLVRDKTKNLCVGFDELMLLVSKLQQKGLIVYPFYVHERTTGFSLFPPLIITDEEIKDIVRIVGKVFSVMQI